MDLVFVAQCEAFSIPPGPRLSAFIHIPCIWFPLQTDSFLCPHGRTFERWKKQTKFWVVWNTTQIPKLTFSSTWCWRPNGGFRDLMDPEILLISDAVKISINPSRNRTWNCKLPFATKQPATLGIILGFGVVRCQATRFLAHTFACVFSASPRCPLSSVHGMTDQVDWFLRNESMMGRWAPRLTRLQSSRSLHAWASGLRFGKKQCCLCCLKMVKHWFNMFAC